MADPARRRRDNVAGPLFVDETCIDCDACRRLAPATFAERGDASAVVAQPNDAEEIAAALRALVACPVAAIGDAEQRSAAAAVASFPLDLGGAVSYLGFHSPDSYGAISYLLAHPDGAWMIDSPRWAMPLVRALERRGGIRYIFLTHRDDVADAARYAKHFGAQRIIHARDRSAMLDAEIVVDGDEPIALGDVTVIPTPGHTRGHCVLLYGSTLFTGDHLAWDRDRSRLTAHRDVCWYDWRTQLRSVARLRDVPFTRILPGHGTAIELPAHEMRTQIDGLLASYG